MKPFLFYCAYMHGTKNYARFYVPASHREQCGGRRHLVFALGSGQSHEIRLRACILENRLLHYFQRGTMDSDWKKIRKYEIDIGHDHFRVKAEGKKEHDALLETLGKLALEAFPCFKSCSLTSPRPARVNQNPAHPYTKTKSAALA